MRPALLPLRRRRGARNLIARTPEQFAEKDIEVLVRHRVERIDATGKKLSVRDLRTGETFEDTYDRLIIATGARAVLPPIPGADLEGVFKLRFLTDSDEIGRYIEERSPRKATIVGGGYIGLEVAENLCRLGMEVSLIEGEDRVALAYGPEVSEKVEAELEANGVGVYTGEQVDEFTGEGRVGGVKFGGKELETDLVIVGVGIRPNVELAAEAGVEIGTTGAILVDRHMKTSIPDVWAAGDCVETTNLVSGRPTWVPLGDTANQMGRVAGTNAATDEETLEFPGVLGTGIFKVFDLGVGKTGLSEKEAAGRRLRGREREPVGQRPRGLLPRRAEGLPQAHRRPGDGTPARRGGRRLRRRQAHRHLRHGPLGQTLLPRPRQHRPRLLPTLRPRPQPRHTGSHHPLRQVRPRQRRRQGLRSSVVQALALSDAASLQL